MPKNVLKNPFGRRRSSGNALDIQPEEIVAPAQSSFRVLERPNKSQQSFDGADRRLQQNRLSQVRPFNSPLQAVRGKSVDDLVGLGANRLVEDPAIGKQASRLIRLRGSGGTTNSNSGSSGYHESSAASARYSSTSTLPSSVDQEREPDEDDLFPRRTKTTPMYHSVGADNDEPLPPPPSFTSRATRALSFGLKNKRPESSKAPSIPTSPIHENDVPTFNTRAYSPTRDRSMTTSSYASTAVPPRIEAKPDLGSSDFGGDFGSMWDDHAKKAKDEDPLPLVPQIGGFHRTVGSQGAVDDSDAYNVQESEPMFPPRSYSRQAFTPSPNNLRNARDDSGSPYSWDDRSSHDGLVSNGSALSSPRLPDNGPPVPAHSNGIAPAFLGGSKQGYSLVPERYGSPGLEQRLSQDSQNSYMPEQSKPKEPEYANRQTQLDEGDRWTRKYNLEDPQESSSSSNNSYKTPASSATSASSSLKPVPQATAGAVRVGAISPGSSTDDSIFGNDSSATPKATKLLPRAAEGESMFDASPSGPPSRAVRPATGHQRTESGTPKKMTKAQFEILQKYSANNSEDETEHDHATDDYDDEDDVERAKQAAKLRRKQEANMTVYRQQMMKSSGGGPTDLPATPRPGTDRNFTNATLSSGMGGLHLGGVDGKPPPDTVRGKAVDDEDEDVPLGILQAHGFPGANRPPTADNVAPRQFSGAGSVVNGGAGQGPLPPFARRLPADPYFGAGLVNNTNRESLAFGNGAASVYGAAPSPAPPQMGHPGGLVGVIAGEERARAARRGSPNPITGGYNMPLPSGMMQPQMQQQMPMMPRTMSMGSVAQAPSVYTPSGAPPMPMMPMMPQMPMDASQAQMQQFMQMQMQVMQNMLAMQQAQMTGGHMPQQPPQQQPLQTNFLAPPPAGGRPMSMASQASTFAPNQGRAMTMMTPPSNWGNIQPQQRPNSYNPLGSYAPSVQGMNMNGGGPGAGYTPSIAPSERSNIGMPTRYRPVQNADGSARSQSMTSSLTLQAFQNQQGGTNMPRPQTSQQEQPKSTIRVIDKAKGVPKSSPKPADADEDEDEGWAEMAKKRNEKKFRWGRKDNSKSELSELYQNYN